MNWAYLLCSGVASGKSEMRAFGMTLAGIMKWISSALFLQRQIKKSFCALGRVALLMRKYSLLLIKVGVALILKPSL